MAEVRWSVSAADDLRAIEEWIARDAPRHAVEFVDHLVDAATKLKRMPRSGRVVPEFGRRDVREVVFRGYRIVYLVRPRVVTVLRVVHGARDLKSLREGEGWSLP